MIIWTTIYVRKIMGALLTLEERSRIGFEQSSMTEV